LLLLAGPFASLDVCEPVDAFDDEPLSEELGEEGAAAAWFGAAEFAPAEFCGADWVCDAAGD